jgi:hypothetical protein
VAILLASCSTAAVASDGAGRAPFDPVSVWQILRHLRDRARAEWRTEHRFTELDRLDTHDVDARSAGTQAAHPGAAPWFLRRPTLSGDQRGRCDNAQTAGKNATIHVLSCQ